MMVVFKPFPENREVNAFSYLYYSLVRKWESMLSPEERPKLKREIVEELVESLKAQAHVVCERAKELINRIEQAYRHAEYEVITFEARLEERGLFGSSQYFGIIPLEVGLEFDPYFNVPIVPGSSIKGTIRSAWQALFDEDEKEAEGYIFGSPERAGACIFHDGYPIEPGKNGYLLYPDVLTPHYMKEGKDILKEHEAEPSPIVYLTIAPGTVFKFIIAMPRDVNRRLRNMLKKALIEALKLGIGGKTSIGYGRFSLRGLHMEVSK